MEVKFDEPAITRIEPTAKPSFLVRTVIQLGMAHDEKSASSALLVLLGVIVLITIGVWVLVGPSAPADVPPPPEFGI